MKLRHALPAVLALCAYAVPGVAIGHGGGEAWIHVPAQSIQPGQPFELLGSDLGPGASVAVAAIAGDRSIAIGTVTADAEGHFTQTLTLPAGVPDGYAQLHAKSSAGVEAFMWVLIGQNTSGAVNPAVAGRTEWWSDPSVIMLGGILCAALVAGLYLAFRSRHPAPASAPALAGRSDPLPRKGSRKARRRVG
jgi:hypothetical protein